MRVVQDFKPLSLLRLIIPAEPTLVDEPEPEPAPFLAQLNLIDHPLEDDQALLRSFQSPSDAIFHPSALMDPAYDNHDDFGRLFENEFGHNSVQAPERGPQLQLEVESFLADLNAKDDSLVNAWSSGSQPHTFDAPFYPVDLMDISNAVDIYAGFKNGFKSELRVEDSFFNWLY